MAKLLTEEQIKKKTEIERILNYRIYTARLKGEDPNTITSNWKDESTKLYKKSLGTLEGIASTEQDRAELVGTYLQLVTENRRTIGYNPEQIEAVLERERETLFSDLKVKNKEKNVMVDENGKVSLINPDEEP
jgi:hypothetical protein